MRILKSLLFLAVLSSTSSLLGQPTVETGGGKTAASVVTTTGWVSFSTTDQDQIKQRLSFVNKSFMSVKVDGEILTNHEAPYTPAKALGASTSVSVGDTIISTWELAKLTLTQRVFPRFTEHGMKIAVHYSGVNKTAKPVKVETQYLLDAQVVTDASSYYETFNNINDHGRKYVDPIPTHIMMTPYDLRHTYPGTLGLMGLLSLTDSLSPALQPSMLIAGQWPELEQIPFADTTYKVPTLNIQDLAFLMQWKEVTIPPSSSAILGGFSYGASDFKYCDNNVLMVVPDTLAVPVFPRSKVLRIPVFVINTNTSAVTIPTLTFNTTGVASFEGGANSITVPHWNRASSKCKRY
jgi:hypothetical protein